MKMYEGVLKRVKQIEEKNGIKYAKTDGKLFATYKVINVLAFIWTIVMNFLYIAGCLLMYNFKDDKEVFLGYVIPIAIGTALLIVSLILCKFKKYLIAGVLNVIPSVVMLVLFGKLSADSLGFMGMKTMYYWRHFAPLTLIIITAFFMAFIAIRADLKLKKMYKKVTENIFNQFGNVENLTDEQWDEFLQNYDHDKFRTQQIAVEEVATEDEG